VALKNTLTYVAVRNLLAAGHKPRRAVIEAAKASATVVQLALISQRLDHWPTQREYASAYDISERTAQLEWELFREAFPGETSPDEIAKWLALNAKPKSEADALTAPAPPDLVPA